jgi:hypothetical protein
MKNPVKKWKQNRHWLASMIAILAGVTGCANTRGPQLVLNSHIAYNKAVSQVISEELLLNIVRRRYLEAPQFVTVTSILTNIGMSANVGASASVDNASPGPVGSGVGVGTFSRSRESAGNLFDFGSLGVSGGVTFSDSPTITLTPLQGDELAGALTARVSPAVVAKLADSGYLIDGLLGLLVQNFAGVRGPQAGLGDAFQGGSPEYAELIGCISRLLQERKLTIGTFRWHDPYSVITYTGDQIAPEHQISAIALGGGVGRYQSFDGGKSFYFTEKLMAAAMWIDEEARETADGRRVIELLNLEPNPLRRTWKLSPSRVFDGPDLNWESGEPRSEVRLLMRSFYGVLDFLSYAVEVPPEDERVGRVFSKQAYLDAVRETRAVDVAKHFKVHWSSKPPKNAYVAVEHHGVWFYIDEGDLRSKRSFNALYDLFNLEIAPSHDGQEPVLSLPVG